MRKHNVSVGIDEKNCTENHETEFMKAVLEKMKDSTNVEALDEETIGMTKRLVVIRISTKHINLWMRQLDMKRGEICKLEGLIQLQEVKNEISEEKNLER